MGRKRDNGKKYIPFHVIIRNGEIYYITTSLTKKGDSFHIVKVRFAGFEINFTTKINNKNEKRKTNKR